MNTTRFSIIYVNGKQLQVSYEYTPADKRNAPFDYEEINILEVELNDKNIIDTLKVFSLIEMIEEEVLKKIHDTDL